MAHPVVESLSRRLDRIMLSMWVAVLFDVVDVGLYFFTIFFNVIVIVNLWKLAHPIWSGFMIALCTWHYVIMAVLLSAYLR